MIFLCSMGDLFHEDVPADFILAVWGVMLEARRHTFQVLTKRIGRVQGLCQWTSPVSYQWMWPSNVWLGVTVENPWVLSRVSTLQQIPAALRFISFEPLLARVGRVDLNGIGWVIVGGENGPGARMMNPDWAREIRDQCVEAGVPFFLKSWGDYWGRPKLTTLDNVQWNQMPKVGGTH